MTETEDAEVMKKREKMKRRDRSQRREVCREIEIQFYKSVREERCAGRLRYSSIS